MYSFIGVWGFGLRHPTAGDDHECLNYQSADTDEYSYDQRKKVCKTKRVNPTLPAVHLFTPHPHI